MATLPNEILHEVFKYLKTSELKQIQLTCRQWYTSATTILYTEVRTFRRESTISFMRVIKSNPTLGALIKMLYLQRVNKDVNIEIQLYFRFITTYCKNLIQQTSPISSSPEYWHRLKLAKLPNLQVLEPNLSVDLRLYNEAALEFRKTLVKVYLRDYTKVWVDGEERDCDNRFYQLSERLQEFEELQNLIVEHSNVKGLAGIDSVIDKCKKLKHLEAYITGGTDSSLYFGTDRNLQAIQQCPHVKSFEGHCSIIGDNNSLLYLMHKFPHLDKLALVYRSINDGYQYQRNVVPTTQTTMVKFINYLIRIPYFRGQIDLAGAETKLFAPLLEKSKHLRQRFLLSYNENVASHSFQFYDTATKLAFKSNLLYEKNKLPHAAFIEESGHLLIDLTIGNFAQIKVSGFDQAQTAERTDHYDLNWLQHILHHCTSLKSLRITNPAKISFNENTMKVHHNLKYLEINHCTDFSILKNISKFCSALTWFEFNTCLRKSMKQVLVDMPFTSFDMLRIETRFPVSYIKVVTPSDSYYFQMAYTDIESSTEDEYAESVRRGWRAVEVIEIHCKSLKRLQLFRDSVHHLNLV